MIISHVVSTLSGEPDLAESASWDPSKPDEETTICAMTKFRLEDFREITASASQEHPPGPTQADDESKDSTAASDSGSCPTSSAA